MACPICGANCQCKKRGPGGICCSCHKHKPRMVSADFRVRTDLTPQEKAGLQRHLEAFEKAKGEEKEWFEEV